MNISLKKFTLENATKAQGRSTGTALLFLSPPCFNGVVGERHAPASLPPGKRDSTHCIAGWLGSDCLALHHDSIPGPPSPYRVTIPTTLPQPTKYFMYKFNKIETLLWYKAVGTFHRSHS